MLYGREAEQRIIGQLLADARNGSSRVLVIRGEAGIGKTALLDFAAGEAAGMTVLRGAGTEVEAELPFAALHMLLRPVLGRTGDLSVRQAAALAGAFGLGPAASADQFLVGMAALSLLAEASGDRPLLCLADDAQWLDAASAGALNFAARRLGADPVALIFAAREAGPDGEPTFPAPGLAELRLPRLDRDACDEVMAAASAGLDPQLRERVLDDAGGNPLAVIEFARALAAGAAGQPALAASAPLPLEGRVQLVFTRQVSRLPAATRALLLTAAADGTGDLGIILRAAGNLGVTAETIAPAERAGLVHVADQLVTFRHPLIRSAAYQAAQFAQRQAAHRALAQALDSGEHADRRAWHLAVATVEPDERVAAELEDAGRRASSRSGYSAAAAAYQRAADLTPGPSEQGRRLAAAAQAARTQATLIMRQHSPTAVSASVAILSSSLPQPRYVPVPSSSGGPREPRTRSWWRPPLQSRPPTRRWQPRCWPKPSATGFSPTIPHWPTALRKSCARSSYRPARHCWPWCAPRRRWRASPRATHWAACRRRRSSWQPRGRRRPPAAPVTGPDELRARFAKHTAAALVTGVASLRPRPGDVPGSATRVALRELGRRAVFLDGQPERPGELIVPLVTARPGLLALFGIGPAPRRCCSSPPGTIPGGCAARRPGRTCAPRLPSRHRRGKSPATGSTPVATARPATPYGRSCSPAWARTRPPAPTSGAARKKESPRPRSSAASSVTSPGRSTRTCALTPADLHTPGTAWPANRLPQTCWPSNDPPAVPGPHLDLLAT